MATQPTKKKGSTSTAMVKWEEELAKHAAEAVEQESSVAAGQFFSFKSGQLSFNDAPIPNNEVAVVILDGIMENTMYEGEYDPNNPVNPVCFAFGRDEKTISPHADVLEAKQAQHDQCHGCPFNEFGSADRGRGKACKNTRRLAVVPAGTFDRTGKFIPYKDVDHFTSTPIAFMKLPVTSIKGYAAFVKSVAATLKRPPFGIFTRVKVMPDATSQFKVIFEPLMEISNDLMGTIFSRHEEAKTVIEFPYQLDPPSQGQKKGARGTSKSAGRQSASRPAAKKKY